ncbi:hypothetical protein HOY82DRAFT_631189 [Tuber indicum]|nr:hypothetical protein HOY82DRAFT_631189 [Tuber indicum]
MCNVASSLLSEIMFRLPRSFISFRPPHCSFAHQISSIRGYSQKLPMAVRQGNCVDRKVPTHDSKREQLREKKKEIIKQKLINDNSIHPGNILLSSVITGASALIFDLAQLAGKIPLFSSTQQVRDETVHPETRAATNAEVDANGSVSNNVTAPVDYDAPTGSGLTYGDDGYGDSDSEDGDYGDGGYEDGGYGDSDSEDGDYGDSDSEDGDYGDGGYGDGGYGDGCYGGSGYGDGDCGGHY